MTGRGAFTGAALVSAARGAEYDGPARADFLWEEMVALSFLINDPEASPRHAPWLRGITPLRVALFIVVVLALAARAGFSRATLDHLPYAIERWLEWARLWFVFGLPLFILVIKCDLWTAGEIALVRVAALAAGVIAGAAILSQFVVGLGLTLDPDFKGRWQYELAWFLRGLFLGSLMAAILYLTRREAQARRELHRMQMSRVEDERRSSESKLQVLNAQIEPHFLFNSLASVKRLYERDPGGGRAMLRNLLTYVKTATARAGSPQSRLGDEIALAKAYLDIFQVRMGARLRVRIDVPAHLEDAVVPSLAIGTLVENAIKHGISPRGAGGTVEISARLADSHLLLDVRDDGVGFRARSGHGIGLANIRAQLETTFRGRAALELSANPAGGVTASLTLPCRFA